jgi:hypothetical protein
MLKCYRISCKSVWPEFPSDHFFCLFVFLSVCLFVCLSFCLFVFLSFCLFVCLSVCFLQIISFGGIFLITSLPSVLRWLQLKLKGKRLEMLLQLCKVWSALFVGFISLKMKFYVFMRSLLTQTIFCSPFNFILIRSVAWLSTNLKNFFFYCNRKNLNGLCFKILVGVADPFL